jgi:hypothetical protein
VRIVLLVPRREDNGPRDKLWAWCRARWEAVLPEATIYEGHHVEGAFNRSAAVNRAASLADRDGPWDLGIVIDADVFLRAAQVREAIATATETGRVTWAHRRWRGISEDWTKRVIADSRDFGPEIDRDDMDILVERTNPISWSCCIVIPRAIWDDLGGFDERFRGWGFEDMAFQCAVVGLYGHERIEGDVYHLHHDRVYGSGRADKLYNRYTAEAITNARLGRRYMVALRRDHGLHDRPGLPSSDAERERDIANLVRDDAALAADVQRLRLPDWSSWWPTLEELRDGAKAARIEAAVPSIAVVVRTGGADEAWPERSAYLRRSLASLNANVSGPIAQRVVYADWAPEFRDELEAIAGEAGFYVAGEGHHGYTASVNRLWRYLDRRVGAEYVFLAEDDFVYDRPVDLVPLAETLRDHPGLAQVALLRAPCYPREMEGGVLGWPEASFEVRDAGNGHGRMEHRLFWTMNPAMIRRSVARLPWPARPSSERIFGDQLLRDPATRFAFWGTGEAWISHIGEVRAVAGGAGY